MARTLIWGIFAAVLLCWDGCSAGGRCDTVKCRPVDPDVTRNVTQLIQSRGYPVEQHDVITKDGFILSVQRIPHGRDGRGNGDPKPVVFLQHGLLADSTNWVSEWENTSLGYILADQGFDVWLGNVRGNRYSKRHIKYKRWQRKFWNFSFETMADYDIPAMIDYALKVTGQPQLYYIGHSQGTLVGFLSFSTNPQIAKKVKLFVALAPIFHLNHTAAIARDAAFILGPIQELLIPLGPTQFLPGYILKLLTRMGFCGGKYSEKMCYDAAEILFGFDDKNQNMSRVPVFASHWPSGTSFKNIIHFGQIIYFGRTARFDYGKLGNMKHYGQPKPPAYDVSKMTTPTAFFVGERDSLSTVSDVAPLSFQIPDLIYLGLIPYWNHIDFVLGMDASKVLYGTIVKMLKDTL